MHTYFTVNRFGQILHSARCGGYETNKTKQDYETKLMSTRILLVMTVRFCIRLCVKHTISLWIRRLRHCNTAAPSLQITFKRV